jgi:hypothetical protein
MSNNDEQEVAESLDADELGTPGHPYGYEEPPADYPPDRPVPDEGDEPRYEPEVWERDRAGAAPLDPLKLADFDQMPEPTDADLDEIETAGAVDLTQDEAIVPEGPLVADAVDAGDPDDDGAVPAEEAAIHIEPA